MDSKRFDSIARSLAAWTSRRRFLGSAAGAATGVMLVHSGNASAAMTLPEVCGAETPPAIAEFIASASNDMLTKLNKLDVSTFFDSPTHRSDSPQLYEFVTLLQCLFAQGSQAASMTPAELILFLSQTQGIVTSFSLGFSECRASQTGQAEGDPGGVRAILAIPPSEICGKAGCTADVLNHLFTCLEGSGNQKDNVFKCFLTFVTEYLFGTATQKACASELAAICKDDCCLGNCWCSPC